MGFIQNRTWLTGAESVVLPSGTDEEISRSLFTACFEAKVCSLQFTPSPIHLSFVLGHPQEWQRQQLKAATKGRSLLECRDNLRFVRANQGTRSKPETRREVAGADCWANHTVFFCGGPQEN